MDIFRFSRNCTFLVEDGQFMERVTAMKWRISLVPKHQKVHFYSIDCRIRAANQICWRHAVIKHITLKIYVSILRSADYRVVYLPWLIGYGGGPGVTWVRF